MIDQVMDLTKLGHQKLAGLMRRLRQEAQGGLATRLAIETMRGPLADAHRGDAGPTEFDHFDTSPSVGAGIITGTVGGPDVDLFATTSATNEAGLIIVDQTPQWTLAAGAGGSTGWGIVSVEWGITTNPFTATYVATPSSGYGTRAIFAHDFCTGHPHKPLHGRTIDSGGGITAHLKVRPLGPAGATVVWFGADLLAISSAACTLIQKMQIWAPENYGPIHTKALWSGGGNGSRSRPGSGRKATISRLFGGGAISDLVSNLKGVVDNSNANTPPKIT